MNKEQDVALELCKVLIGRKISVTDEEINSSIDKIYPLYDKKIDKDLLKEELLSYYSVQIGEYQILEGKDRREPWLKDFKSKQLSNWDYWRRYCEYLEKDKKFPHKIILELDDLTDTILDKLFNPKRDNIVISKKGLVVGQVQSGKTANYIGLINKAADAGFNFFIILAGIHNNLRSQTQTRIDEGFLGYDTQNTRAFILNKTLKMGVGLISNYKNLFASSYTTSIDKGDFSKRAANISGINFSAPNPIILVVKKNANILKNLAEWLKTHTTNEKVADKSLLIIDDEADNASINTNRVELDPTTINKYICTIIDLFTRSAYVGYTATPFANIFIPLDPNNLFPRDFIISLPTPSNYIGPEKVFGTSAVPDEEDDDLLPIVIPINDFENFVPENHKINDTKPGIENIPESLKTALKCFIITCAIRIIRGQENKHNSMLIHVSRYQAWQNHIKELVEQLFNYYKQNIEAKDTAVLEEFRHVFEVDTDNYNSFITTSNKILASKYKDIDNYMKIHSWSDVENNLFAAVQKIEVISINGKSIDSLTYYEHDKTGISVIAIGGDKLSRGLTLEGLSVSYFLRASKMYDTLMQMGRWFGYRTGYVDLCRLFTSQELNEWFRHITIASEDLKSEFTYLAESGGTPENYALKVMTHPGGLQITSINKMRYTQQIEVSWAGRLVETYQLSMDRKIKYFNLLNTKQFISLLGNNYTIVGRNNNEHNGGDYLWKNISPDKVCDYLQKFRVGETMKMVNMELICEYILALNKKDELTNWSICLRNKTAQNIKTYNYTDEIKVGCFNRTRANDTNYDSYYIRKNHIVGRQDDEFVDLNEDILDNAMERTWKYKTEVKKEKEWSELNNEDRKRAKEIFDKQWDRMTVDEKKRNWKFNFPAPEIVRNEFRPTNTPLLLIYALNPIFANLTAKDMKKAKSDFPVYSENDDPFIGLVISFPRSNVQYAVSYKVNQVGNGFIDTENTFDSENDNTYDDEK